jgi:hypothetical protein
VDPNNNQNGQHDAWTPGPDTATPQPDAYVPPGDAAICTDVVDVVFVLDVSSSMNFVLEQLGTGIGDVVAAANGLAPDAHFGLIPFVDNHAIDLTGDLEGGKVHTQASTLQAAFTYTMSTYTNPNRNPGDGPTGPETQNPICEENAADALYAAATEFPWRDNATRVIILATDDTFLERPDNYGDRDGDGDWDQTNFPREGNYPALRTMAETVLALQTARVRVFAFTKLEPPGTWDFDKCGTGRRLDWEAVSWGWSDPYNGAEPIPAATDGGNYDLDQIKDESLSLSATINEVVVQSFCNPPVL